MTIPEASAKYNIKANTIRVRARRDKWVLPSRVADVLRNRDNQAVVKATQDWLSKGEKHREKVFSIAEKSLATVKKVRVKNAKDLEIVDRAARRAAGLDTGDGQVAVLITLNERMANFEEEQPIEKSADVREVEAEVNPIPAEDSNAL